VKVSIPHRWHDDQQLLLYLNRPGRDKDRPRLIEASAGAHRLRRLRLLVGWKKERTELMSMFR
jgi:hypothetical protein